MLGEKAFVQHFVAEVLREVEIGRHHGILPGDGVLPHFRVLVIVAFTDDAVVHGMVHQVQALILEQFELGIVLGKETHIIVGGRDLHASRLGGVHLGEGVGHVGHGVGVVQLFSQLDHLVVQFVLGVAAGIRIQTAFLRTGQQEQQG